ncbi:MAG: FeoB-associated Cys-rich membrane protein [Oscillospiraceae bacterium]
MGTVLISLLLLAIVAAIIRYMVKLKKGGKVPLRYRMQR